MNNFSDFITLILLALALSMDAFAVSISMGMSAKLKKNEALFCASSFGFFQGLMPWLGFLASLTLKNIIDNYSHIIAFILLSFIGAKMIYEVYNEKNDNKNTSFSIKTLILLSIATSIDAFAAGISLIAININIYICIIIISLITFCICLCGIYFGKKVGSLFQHKAQILGGVVLIAIGIKLLIGGF